MRRSALLLACCALLASGAGGAGDAWCEDACDCRKLNAERTLFCPKDAEKPKVTLYGMSGSYVKVVCGEEISCEEFPSVPFGLDTASPSLGLSGCAATAGCLLRRLHFHSVKTLTLRQPPAGTLISNDTFDGVEGLEKLMVYTDLNDNVTMSPDALSSLTSLRSLLIQGVRLEPSAATFQSWPASLRTLTLTKFGAKRLGAKAFASMKDLEKLLLFETSVEEIDDHAFEGLDQLLELDVSSGALSSLPVRALRSLPRLNSLAASGNPMTSLPALGDEGRVYQLTDLRIIFNRSPLEISPRALAGLPILAEVQLQGSGIQALPADFLTNSSKIKLLDISGNALTTLPDGLFADQVELTVLKLERNKLSALSARLFANARRLERLTLDRNQLTTLPSGFLDGLTKLSFLSASRNQLATLSLDSLGGAAALENLDLSHNSLVFHDPQADESMAYATSMDSSSPFDGLSQLRRLDLSHNRLRFGFPFLANLLFLQTYDVSNNRIEELGLWSGELQFISNNITMDASHNRISQVTLDLQAPLLTKTSSDSRESVVIITDNPFHCDCHLYGLALRLRGYQPLEGLGVSEPRFEGNTKCIYPSELRHQSVKTAPLEKFVCKLPMDQCVTNCSCTVRPHTQSFEMMCSTLPPKAPDYGNNKLKLGLLYRLPTLQGLLPDIVSLNLSNLALETIPEGLTSTLQEIDLSGNRLRRVPIDLLVRNVTVRLARNPLGCSCWEYKDLVALTTYSHLIADLHEVTCEDGSLAWRLDAGQVCNTLTASLAGGLLALLGITVGVSAMLFYRYTLEIKVWLYSRGLCARWVNESELDKDRPYDAFLSFSHEDERFVIDELLPGLDAEFKICVHFRDWMPGEWIPAQIAQSVEQSRRTVVVLSNSFLNSIWGRLEFRAAHMSAIKESRSRVVVVLLEDVTPNKEMDAELRFYLATNTYLRWGDPWFWDKLRYALPHRRGEIQAREGGRKLVARAVGGTITGGLNTCLTKDGKLVNMAAIKAADCKELQIIK